MIQTTKNIPHSGSQAQELKAATLEKVQHLVQEGLLDQVDEGLIKTHITKILQNSDKKLALHYLEKSDIGLYRYLPTSLKNDIDIIRLVLTQNVEIFHQIDLEQRKNPTVLEVSMHEAISQQVPVSQLIAILDVARRDNKGFSKQIKKLKAILKKREEYFKTAFEKSLFMLYIEDYDAYQKIIGTGVITSSGNGVGEKLVNFLQQVGEELASLPPKDMEIKLKEKIYSFVNISGNISKNLKDFIDSLAGSISLKEILPKQEAQEDGDESEDDIREENDIGDESLHEVEYLRSYNYSHIGTNYTIWDTAGAPVQIGEQEIKNISQKSLERYIKFSSLLGDLGLAFLLKKHKQKISLATGVNFLEGEGMSEARILKFFNSLGKNIGVPEESYEDEKGNKKIGCFQTLGAAKLKFREIKDSGKIGDIDTNNLSIGDKSTVEFYMKYKGLIIEPFGEISIAKWK